jgi:hypothetical protein
MEAVVAYLKHYLGGPERNVSIQGQTCPSATMSTTVLTWTILGPKPDLKTVQTFHSAIFLFVVISLRHVGPYMTEVMPSDWPGVSDRQRLRVYYCAVYLEMHVIPKD